MAAQTVTVEPSKVTYNYASTNGPGAGSPAIYSAPAGHTYAELLAVLVEAASSTSPVITGMVGTVPAGALWSGQLFVAFAASGAIPAAIAALPDDVVITAVQLQWSTPSGITVTVPAHGVFTFQTQVSTFPASHPITAITTQSLVAGGVTVTGRLVIPTGILPAAILAAASGAWSAADFAGMATTLAVILDLSEASAAGSIAGNTFSSLSALLTYYQPPAVTVTPIGTVTAIPTEIDFAYSDPQGDAMASARFLIFDAAQTAPSPSSKALLYDSTTVPIASPALDATSFLLPDGFVIGGPIWIYAQVTSAGSGLTSPWSAAATGDVTATHTAPFLAAVDAVEGGTTTIVLNSTNALTEGVVEAVAVQRSQDQGQTWVTVRAYHPGSDQVITLDGTVTWAQLGVAQGAQVSLTDYELTPAPIDFDQVVAIYRARVIETDNNTPAVTYLTSPWVSVDLSPQYIEWFIRDPLNPTTTNVSMAWSVVNFTRSYPRRGQFYEPAGRDDTVFVGDSAVSSPSFTLDITFVDDATRPQLTTLRNLYLAQVTVLIIDPAGQSWYVQMTDWTETEIMVYDRRLQPVLTVTATCTEVDPPYSTNANLT